MQGENERLRGYVDHRNKEIARLDSLLCATAAFLDRKAREFSTMGFDHDAADCRAMAAKLRGEA